MDVIFELIQNRRSVRRFQNAPVPDDHIKRLIEAARCAPSGKNGRPWKFAALTHPGLIRCAAAKLRYSRFVKAAPCVIGVFLSLPRSYHREKDLMSAGAAIQNLLLCAHSMGYGTCWIGEATEHEEEIRRLFTHEEEVRLLALVAVGTPQTGDPPPPPRQTEDFFLCRRDYQEKD